MKDLLVDVLKLLSERRSEKKLTTPAPSPEQLELILKSALQVPDHGKLQPYHFVVIKQEQMAQFAELLKDAVDEFEMGEEKLQKAQNLANRAPLVIGVVAKINPDVKKVPTWEQMLTAGCAAYSIQLAANALGFANVWVSGKWVDGSALRQAFGCQGQDKVVALLMIGTPQNQCEKEKRCANLADFVSYL